MSYRKLSNIGGFQVDRRWSKCQWISTLHTQRWMVFRGNNSVRCIILYDMYNKVECAFGVVLVDN
jgi:hypothetical protein